MITLLISMDLFISVCIKIFLLEKKTATAQRESKGK